MPNNISQFEKNNIKLNVVYYKINQILNVEFTIYHDELKMITYKHKIYKNIYILKTNTIFKPGWFEKIINNIHDTSIIQKINNSEIYIRNNIFNYTINFITNNNELKNSMHIKKIIYKLLKNINAEYCGITNKKIDKYYNKTHEIINKFYETNNYIIKKYRNIFENILNVFLKSNHDKNNINYDIINKFEKSNVYFNINKNSNENKKIKLNLNYYEGDLNINLTFNLLITLYDENNDDRFCELAKCLELNLKNKNIKNIHIFYEKTTGKFQNYFNNHKIKVIIIKERPCYNDFIDYSNINLNDQNIILSNSDIIFDDSLNLLKDENMIHIYAITRYNLKENIQQNKYEYDAQYMNNDASQDTWIFKSPINKLNSNLKIGTFTCDSFLNAEFINSDKLIFNISREIHTFHLQNSKSSSQIECKKTEDDIYYKYIEKEIINISDKPKQRRMLVCGLPNITLSEIKNKSYYYYPEGNDECCDIKSGINRCSGCDYCSWDKYFPAHLKIYDILISSFFPYKIKFDNFYVFSGINCDDNNNIIEILYSMDDKFYSPIKLINNKFEYMIEAQYFKIYYKKKINLSQDMFIIYNNLSNKKIIISGIIKNGEKYLDKTFENIERIKKYFQDYVVYIYENNSKDNTKNKLEEWKKSDNKFFCECENLKKNNMKQYEIMAYCRNKCRYFINKQSDLYGYVLLLDLDLQININIISIMNCFNLNNTWDVQFANGIYTYDFNYWDSFALRTQLDNIAFYYDLDEKGANKYWKHMNTYQKQKRICELIEVDSGFGGMGLYKKNCFEMSSYDENTNDCEHVQFHKKLKNMGLKLFVNPKFIKLYSIYETQGSYYTNNKFDKNTQNFDNLLI
jgi:hypothetical protein